MRVIHKYVIEPGFFTLDLQEGAEVLTVQMQGGSVVMWVRVEDSNTKRPKRFLLAGTGHDLEGASQWCYHGTVQVGVFVFHLLSQ